MKKKWLSKEEWLFRCITAWELGFVKDREVTADLRAAADAFVRFRDVYNRHPEYFAEIEKDQQGNIGVYNLTISLDDKRSLANDSAYKAVQMACILDHPCQHCAEDKAAWHTRYAFCDHKKLK
jgi:hypothetical protein